MAIKDFTYFVKCPNHACIRQRGPTWVHTGPFLYLAHISGYFLLASLSNSADDLTVATALQLLLFL